MAEKRNREISILVDGVKKVGYGRYGQLETIFEFKTPEDVISAAIEFLDQIKNDQDLVERMVECVDKTPLVYGKFRIKLIQILEDKFGVKIKICENCRSYRGIVVSVLVPGGDPRPVCLKRSGKEDLSLEILSTGCGQWEPKEISEEK